MSIIDIITLLGIMIALAALPSASVALVITRSATLGVANGVAVTAGIILVSCHKSNVGYNRLSLTRASSVLKCQFTLA